MFFRRLASFDKHPKQIQLLAQFSREKQTAKNTVFVQDHKRSFDIL